MTVETTTATEADQRIEQAFGHEEHCHTHGCPGLGYCATVDHETRDRVARGGGLLFHEAHDCGARHCTCITAAIRKVVRDERALVLELAGEAIFGYSAKPQRGLRHLRRFAKMVREGEA